MNIAGCLFCLSLFSSPERIFSFFSKPGFQDGIFFRIDTHLFQLFSTGLGKVNSKFVFLEFCKVHPLETGFLINIDKFAFIGERNDRKHVFGFEESITSCKNLKDEFTDGLLKGLALEILDREVLVYGFPEIVDFL